MLSEVLKNFRYFRNVKFAGWTLNFWDLQMGHVIMEIVEYLHDFKQLNLAIEL